MKEVIKAMENKGYVLTNTYYFNGEDSWTFVNPDEPFDVVLIQKPELDETELCDVLGLNEEDIPKGMTHDTDGWFKAQIKKLRNTGAGLQ